MSQPIIAPKEVPDACGAARSVRDVIDLWPSRKALADDLQIVGADGEMTVDRVHKWAKRNAIPSPYHGRILRAAEQRGYSLSAADLVAAHDAPTQPPTEDAA